MKGKFSEKTVCMARLAKADFNGEHLWVTVESVNDGVLFGKIDTPSTRDPVYREGKEVGVTLSNVLELLFR